TSAADIHQVSRKVSLRSRAATQRGPLDSATHPHPHEQQHRQEKERRHRCQSNDQVQSEPVLILLSWIMLRLGQRQVRLRKAIHQQHMQSDTGRARRIAIVLDQ
ncbi:hypothetical protein LEMLEM_LOCUS7434, partial [Lemmus lemmus]